MWEPLASFARTSAESAMVLSALQTVHSVSSTGMETGGPYQSVTFVGAKHMRRINMAHRKQATRRGMTVRQKMHLPAKAGKRHVRNPNHPAARPADQIAAMQKGVR